MNVWITNSSRGMCLVRSVTRSGAKIMARQMGGRGQIQARQVTSPEEERRWTRVLGPVVEARYNTVVGDHGLLELLE